MPFEKYPANRDYEYSEVDILITAEKIISESGWEIVFSDDEVNSLFDGENLREDALPAKLKRSNNTLSSTVFGFEVILMGDCQSEHCMPKFLDFIETSDMRRMLIIFPFHKGYSKSQSGHWNLGAIFVDKDELDSCLYIYEPLGQKGREVNSSAIVDGVFYKNIGDRFSNFELSQETWFTGQQSDAKLCGAIAAENMAFFLKNFDSRILEKNFSSEEEILTLRQRHIDLVNSELFAKRQFENWMFTDSLDKDFIDQKGEDLCNTLKLIMMKDPNSERTNDLKKVFLDLREEENLEEVSKALKIIRECWVKHKDTLSREIVNGTDENVFDFCFIADETDADYKTNNKRLNDDPNDKRTRDIIMIFVKISKLFIRPKYEENHKDDNANSSGQYGRNILSSAGFRGFLYQAVVAMDKAFELYVDPEVISMEIRSETDSNQEYNFGKFDDIVIKRSDGKKISYEIVQVKYAAAEKEAGRIYESYMLAPLDQDDLKKEEGKKAGLYRYINTYFDIWNQLRLDEAKPDFKFLFYTNHQLSEKLRLLFNTENKTFDHALGLFEHDSKKKREQKRLFDSLFMHSKELRRFRARGFLERLVFRISKDENDLCRKIIDKNIEFLTLKLINDSTLHYTGAAKKIRKDEFDLIRYLLSGVFSRNNDGRLECGDFFERDLSNKPLHEYFKNKLNERLAEKADYDSCLERIKLKSWKFSFSSLSDAHLIPGFKEREEFITTLDFSNNDSPVIIIKDSVYTKKVLLLFGGGYPVQKYDSLCLNISDKLANALADHASFPVDKFENPEALPDIVKDFIKEFTMSLAQKDLSDLEASVANKISNYFKIYDLRHYKRFYDLFVENFREARGDLITKEVIKECFDRASDSLEAQRLVGFVQRENYHEKDCLNIVSDEFTKYLDKWYGSISVSVLIVHGENGIGKSFSVRSWLVNKGLKEDGYAFLSINDTIEKDIETFSNSMDCFVIDAVNTRTLDNKKKSILSSLIERARFKNKKLILITSELDELLSQMNGCPRVLLQCPSLTQAQVKKFLLTRYEHVLAMPSFLASPAQALVGSSETGLSRVLRNPAHALAIKNSRLLMGNKEFEKHINHVKRHRSCPIYLNPTVRLHNEIALSKVLEREGLKLIIISPGCDEYFSEIDAYSQNISKLKDLRECEEINLDKELKSFKKNEQSGAKKMILVVSAISINLFCESDISEIYLCDSSQANASLKILKSSAINKLKTDETTNEENSMGWDVVLQRVPYPRRVLVEAGAGMGKSTLAKRWVRLDTYSCNKGRDFYLWRILVFLDALELRNNSQSLSVFLLERIKESLQNDNHLPRNEKLPDWLVRMFEHDLNNNNVLIIADGGDQITSQQLLFAKDIIKRIFDHSAVILLTRPDQCPVHFQSNAKLELLRFDDDAVKKYFSHKQAFGSITNPFYKSAISFIKKNESLRELLGVPLQCYLFLEAYRDSFLHWKKNNDPSYLPSVFLKSKHPFIALYERFVREKFIIFYRSRLKITPNYLEEKARAISMSADMLDRFSHVSALSLLGSVSNHLADESQLPPVTPISWQDNDIVRVGLIEYPTPPDSEGRISYVVKHRTYCEFAAARFFIGGVTGTRIVRQNQYDWCLGVLLIGRFYKNLSKFWQFVFKWAQYQCDMGNISNLAHDQFKSKFTENGDLIQSLEMVYFSNFSTNAKKISTPRINLLMEAFSSNENPSEDRVFTDTKQSPSQHDCSYNDDPIKEGFDIIEDNLLKYNGCKFVKSDDPLCRRIRLLSDFLNAECIDHNRIIKILKHVKKPAGKLSPSYNVQSCVLEVLVHLANHGVHEALHEIFDYFGYDYTNFEYDLSLVYGELSSLNVNDQNIHAFLIEINYIIKMVSNLPPNWMPRMIPLMIYVCSSLGYEHDDTMKKIKELVIQNIEIFDFSPRYLDRIDELLNYLSGEFISNISSLDNIKKIKSPIARVYLYLKFHPKKIKSVDVVYLLTGAAKEINRSEIAIFIDRLSQLRMEPAKVLRAWLSLPILHEPCDIPDSALDKAITFSQETEISGKEYRDIDGGIKAACSLGSNLDYELSGYLLKCIENPYYQTQDVLAKEVPSAVEKSVLEGASLTQRGLSLYVYHKAMINYINQINDKIDQGQDYMSVLSRLKSLINARFHIFMVMEQAVRCFEESALKDGNLARCSLRIIRDISFFSQWPVIKQRNRLIVIVPMQNNAYTLKSESKVIDAIEKKLLALKHSSDIDSDSEMSSSQSSTLSSSG